MTTEAIDITAATAAVSAASSNGASFDVDALTNLIVPFEFPFEGQKLTGHWLKYKTTTPDHIRERREAYMQRLERFAALEEQVKLSADPNEVVTLQKEKNDLQEEAQRIRYSWIADAIVDWNATSQGQPIPVDVLRMSGFPLPFLVALGDHLAGTRTGENPTLPRS